MAEESVSLITLSEAQRTSACVRCALLRPALQEGVSQTQTMTKEVVEVVRDKGLYHV
jgi:hypothetical protein